MSETFAIKYQDVNGIVVQVNVTPRQQSQLYVNEHLVLTTDTDALMKLASAILAIKK